MHRQPMESSYRLGSNMVVLTAENEVHLLNELQSVSRLLRSSEKCYLREKRS